MQRAHFGVGAAIVLSALVACVGGPGPLPGETDGEGSGGGRGDSRPPTTDPAGPREPNRPGDDQGGASNPPRISASEFETSCTSDEECVAVYEGSVCPTECACPNTAISVQSASDYAKELTELAKTWCSDLGDVDCVDCPSVTAKCVSGTCRLE